MDPTTVTLTRVYNSGALGAGTRTVTGTVTVTRVVGTPDTTTPSITISAISGMTDAELASYQAFVNLLDEESTLAQALIVLDEEPA